MHAVLASILLLILLNKSDKGMEWVLIRSTIVEIGVGSG